MNHLCLCLSYHSSPALFCLQRRNSSQALYNRKTVNSNFFKSWFYSIKESIPTKRVGSSNITTAISRLKGFAPIFPTKSKSNMLPEILKILWQKNLYKLLKISNYFKVSVILRFQVPLWLNSHLFVYFNFFLFVVWLFFPCSSSFHEKATVALYFGRIRTRLGVVNFRVFRLFL